MNTWMMIAALICFGCSSARPSAEQCKAAVDNIRSLTGMTADDIGSDPRTMVRSCRARSSVRAVQCLIAAKSRAALAQCEGKVGAQLKVEGAGKTGTDSPQRPHSPDKPTSE